MKPIRDNSNQKAGFTIVELLTVMSIIIILISLLMPALNRVRRYATRVKQKAQFHSIAVAMDLFNAENEGYPPSDRYDGSGGTDAYCGAMKLAEAMVGEDLKGFDPNSRFKLAEIPTLYPLTVPAPGDATYADYINKIKSRRMYLQLEKANVFRFSDIYTPTHITAGPVSYSVVDPCNIMLLCDSYVRTMATGNKVGMPILYYKADTNKNEHNRAVTCDSPLTTDPYYYDIYKRCDNQDFVDIPLPWVSPPSPVHPMASSGTTLAGATADSGIFYDETQNKKITMGPRPYMADSYILISAGFDGEYGTSDDVFNFGD
jgi:type II secretory pathway pseudopilin PulG